MLKRLFDIMAALAIIALLLPLLLAVAVIIKLNSKGPVFYLQTRVGQNKKPFTCIKFRTMAQEDDIQKNEGITGHTKAHRINKFSAFLRRTRIDEMPQIFNVLLGDMSLVGPRPQIPLYVETYPEEYAFITSVKPGVTGLTALRYHLKESELLKNTELDPEEKYVKEILPRKFRYDYFYIKNQSFLFDMKIIFWTVWEIWYKQHVKVN